MKRLFVLFYLSVFSIVAFGHPGHAEGVHHEAITDEAKEEAPKEAVADEVKKEAPKEAVADTAKEEAPKEAVADTAKEEAPQEQPEAVAQEAPAGNDYSDVSVQAGVNYECDNGKSYILHEPGVNSESNLCELDAGHTTENPADWYALNDSSFCKQKLQEMVSIHNCSVKE